MKEENKKEEDRKEEVGPVEEEIRRLRSILYGKNSQK